MTPHCGAGKSYQLTTLKDIRTTATKLQVKAMQALQVNDTARDTGKYTASSAVNRY